MLGIMSRAHNSWVNEPHTSAPHIQSHYRSHEPSNLHNLHLPPPSDLTSEGLSPRHESTHQRAADRIPLSPSQFSQRLPSLSHHGVQSQSRPAHQSPPAHFRQPLHLSPSAPSPSREDDAASADYSQSHQIVKSEPTSNQGSQDLMHLPRVSSGFQYPGVVSRRPSAGTAAFPPQLAAHSGSAQSPRFGPGSRPVAMGERPMRGGGPKLEDGDHARAAVLSGGHAASQAKYRICVRQHPAAARSCGFGERDRRVIDPPPIIQVLVDSPGVSDQERKMILRYPFGVMHCSIWSEDGKQDCSTMADEYRSNRRLMGTPVSTPFVGFDDNDQEGCFYCFPDLSVRTPGAYRLRFSLVILNPAINKDPGKKVPVLAVVMSDVFRVYNAKDFPGMQASTPLTKRLKEQGCLISIKKGKDHGGGARGRDDSDEEEEEEEGLERVPRPNKRYRR